ncbi:hypothetical protein [Flavobacterium ginsenosidimutans]|uniref:Lipoprotein n=1 Tax=Flavobacterium ginsenosidimutans TaxID=687844 RepID=A0ABZ2Q0L8_9FLAO|nr:hypothetical protein [Flavobacterium ginsenosidimutans]KAF2331703.1 hypothetical protein DM444_10910 [Flavobacterium ginsenosidimutans]
MKKYAALLLFALFLNGCDDGDLTVDTIDFVDADSQACDPETNTLIYKLKTQEALLLQMPEGKIVNDPGTYSYPIDSKGTGSYRVVYRAYDGTVATANICGTIPPSTPKVTEEWIATDGVIEITTSQDERDISTNPDDGSRIHGYNHTIIFRNITFNKPAGDQTEEKFDFGTYTTSITPADLTFKTNPNGSAYECDEVSRVYNYNNSFYISIDDIDPALIVNTPTNGVPRTSLITATQNKVYYKTAKAETGSITPAFICSKVQPASPAIEETWTGQLGVAATSGIIEVTTTLTGQVYEHTIVLKNVILEKDNSHFRLGSSFVLGKIDRVATN